MTRPLLALAATILGLCVVVAGAPTFLSLEIGTNPIVEVLNNCPIP